MPPTLPRRTSAAMALALPSLLALMATTCAVTPPAASPTAPVPSAPGDAAAPRADAAVEIASPSRTLVLLQPPTLAPEAGAIVPLAPDPPPLVEKDQWVYELRYDRGELYLVGVHPLALAEPRATPRVIGRFALELYSGPTLIERVRFDFPGLGAADRSTLRDGGRQPMRGAAISFTSKLTTRVGVMLPATARGTRLDLWDRATNRRWPLPWPAVEMTTAVADAGTVAEPVAPD